MPREITKGPRPASFEELREYLTDAVDQLTEELAQQQANYLVPADNVVELVEAVAAVRNESPWATWESWALRHAVPVHQMVTRGVADGDLLVLRKRLRDLLGYCVLGLVMTERR